MLKIILILKSLYPRMPLTPAEKQRRYREKLKRDPGKYEQVKIKDKER